MVCLLAILLYTGTRLPQKDRLVITTSERRFSSYGDYQVNYSQLFPEPDVDSGIYRTLVDFDGPGTYLTAYCSNRVVASVAGFSNDESSEKECFDYVNNLYRQQVNRAANRGFQEGEVAESVLLPVSDLTESHQCTKRLLISLTYQQRILSADSYGINTGYRDKLLPKIKFDGQVDISKVVLGEQFLMMKYQSGIRDVLAWNQGQLQIFTQDSFSQKWREKTTIGDGPYPGYLIAELIQSNNPPIRKFIKKFIEREGFEKIVPKCFGMKKKVTLAFKASREDRYKSLQIKVGKFVPVTAEGIIDGLVLFKPSKRPEEDL
ncbi:CSEP0451 putative effector protein [Blumeria hordei DH14]|uniref:CSEP0451 putative effector protein n=1 Tax=Blumeria graminis f. sp. hordei (strain DH14) TaxID=546991 RepID=N1JNS2_BLUG1|nr:CSEP0451 putative effector protein [Blumeria hordei DH14]